MRVNLLSYAVALQTHSLALILVISHHPSLNAIGNNRRAQHLLVYL